MFAWLGAIVKGFMDSAFSAFRIWRSDRSREKAAEIAAENARLKKNIELRKRLDEEDKNRKKSKTLGDAIDRFDSD
jgi:hypothetical protein